MVDELYKYRADTARGDSRFTVGDGDSVWKITANLAYGTPGDNATNRSINDDFLVYTDTTPIEYVNPILANPNRFEHLHYSAIQKRYVSYTSGHENERDWTLSPLQQQQGEH